jgi:hypothetical protein
MKIDKGGTPIWVSRRHIGGAEIIQGRSRVKLSREEMRELNRILNEMSANDAPTGQEKMTTIGNL